MKVNPNTKFEDYPLNIPSAKRLQKKISSLVEELELEKEAYEEQQKSIEDATNNVSRKDIISELETIIKELPQKATKERERSLWEE